MGKKSHYKQLGKIGDKVLCKSSRSIGTIKQIDNKCNLRDNNRTVNEYYVLWPKDRAWTRHDCYHLDTSCEEDFILMIGAAKVLYATKD